MTTTYVAIDLETTGLDPARDAIIEVAAVTFRGNDVIEEFTSLVNPLRDIPPFVSQLTGITDAMVAVSYTHLRAHETVLDLVCRLLLEKKQILR